MKHRLGSLRIDMQAATIPLTGFGRGSSGRGFSGQRFLQAMRDLDPSRHSDLRTVLEADDPDRGWVETVAETVAQLRGDGRPLSLANCERTTGPAGQCVITLFERGRAAPVRRGDPVYAGVAVLRSPATGIAVMPRVFRQVCSNGAVLDCGAGERREIDSYQVADAMLACLEPVAFSAAVEQFRHAARTPVDDIDQLLRHTDLVTPIRPMLDEWERAGDRSWFGLVNAATALAHGERDPAHRLERERDAGRLLDLMALVELRGRAGDVVLAGAR